MFKNNIDATSLISFWERFRDIGAKPPVQKIGGKYIAAVHIVSYQPNRQQRRAMNSIMRKKNPPTTRAELNQRMRCS